MYGAVRKEALLTSQIEGTQAMLTDLLDEEAGFAASNTEDVEEVTNYLLAFRLVQDNLRDPKVLPMMPRFNIERARQILNTTFPTASVAVNQLVYLGLVKEMTGKKNRNYSYQGYVDLLIR